MTPSIEGSPTKAKETPSPNEVRLTPLDTNPVFQCLGDKWLNVSMYMINILMSQYLYVYETPENSQERVHYYKIIGKEL